LADDEVRNGGLRRNAMQQFIAKFAAIKRIGWRHESVGPGPACYRESVAARKETGG
jgi:hypothetical protein